MSDDSLGTDASGSSSPDKRRSTVPDILPQQRSFEKRYSHIIHRQILETGVNKEALQRQLNAFFSCSGDKKKNSDESTEHKDAEVVENDGGVAGAEALDDGGEAGTEAEDDGGEGAEAVDDEAEGVAAEDDGADVDESKKSLEKLDTLDIAEAN